MNIISSRDRVGIIGIGQSEFRARRDDASYPDLVREAVVLAMAVSGFTAYREHQAGKAAFALESALAAKQGNWEMLEKVAQEYGATPSGLWAKIELALLEEKEGQRPKAL